MIRMTTAVMALLAVFALAACGERKEQTTSSAGPAEPLKLMLDYLPNADHAGIYEAKADGNFEKAKIALDIETPSDPAAPLKLLAGGQIDLAISYEPELLLARDKGADLVSVAALVQKPLTSVISIEGSGVKKISDLRGKKIGTAGIPYQSAFLKAILEKAGVESGDVEEVNVGFGLTPAMLSKRVDATLGSFWNYEGVQLQRRKRNPTIIPVDKAGIPTYNELVVVARADDLRDRGPVIRRFLQALGDGQRAVREDPEQASKDLVAQVPALKKERAFQLAVIKATNPVFFPASDDRPFGYQDAARWARFGAWMQTNNLITQPADPRSLTNEFLPGEALRPTDLG